MSCTMDAMPGSTINRHLAKLFVLMFVTMLLQVTVHAVPAENLTIDQHLERKIDDIFSGYPMDCECVPFNLCKNDPFNVYGVGVFERRNKKEQPCYDPMQKCCKTDSDSSIKSTPTTNFIPCGNWNPGGTLIRIIGDTQNEAQFGEFPWMMLILDKDPRTQITMNVCGGSLIHPQVVMTAAHCVHNKNNTNLVIRAGEWDSRTEDEWQKHQDRKVLKIIKHEQFDFDTAFNDVALIIVTEPFQILPHVSTICLPSQDFVFSDERCYASGWGKNAFTKQNEADEYQNILKKIDLPIVPRDPCLKLLRKTRLTKNYLLHKSFMCAGGEVGKDTCEGDGGGPLVCPIDKKSTQYVQAGIVVYGVGCGTQAPGVYANVTMFRNWIDEKMKNENLETHYYDSKSYNNTVIPGETQNTNGEAMAVDEKIDFVFNELTN